MEHEQQDLTEYHAHMVFSYLVLVKDQRLGDYPIPLFVDVEKVNVLKLFSFDKIHTSIHSKINIGADLNVVSLGDSPLFFEGCVTNINEIIKQNEKSNDNEIAIDLYRKNPDDLTFSLQDKTLVDISVSTNDIEIIKYMVDQIFNYLIFIPQNKELVNFHLHEVDETYKAYWEQESRSPSFKISSYNARTPDKKEKPLLEWQEWGKRNTYMRGKES